MTPVKMAQPFLFTPRQFVGGALALDLVNTAFYAEDPTRRGDRLRTPDDLARWLEAAIAFGAAGDDAAACARAAAAIDPASFAEALLLRQAADDMLRGLVRQDDCDGAALRMLLFLTGKAAGEGRLERGEAGLVCDSAGPAGFIAAAGLSALALLRPSTLQRLKVCPACHWLFLDRSRNRSRVWCDMQVCGNREKTRRHAERLQPANHH